MENSNNVQNTNNVGNEVSADVRGCTGIFVDVNPRNDPRWSRETGIKMKHPIETLRCYDLGKGKVSFKKPRQSECECVVCFNVNAYGVRAYKVKNWEELPDLPFNEEILKDNFFDSVKVKVV